MYIQLENDYTANDNKGAYVHFVGEDEHDEGDLALVRIENGRLIWYESQNGECICESNGDYMTGDNIELVCQYLLKQFPGAEIDRIELGS